MPAGRPSSCWGLALLLGGHLAGAAPPLDLFGICYAPVPLKDGTSSPILDDDFMSEDAKPLWGMRGRDDLTTMRNMGASVVRLYGNNPNKSHTSFLDEAVRRGLRVIPGISDYPYTQMDGNCNAAGGDCYRQVMDAYLSNLQRGFLLPDKTYHPALAHVVIVNEPDMKIGVPESAMGRLYAPKDFARAVISAADGMLDAEKAANATGQLVNLTATVTFSACEECMALVGDRVRAADVASPFGLSQMLVLQQAFLDPEAFGYIPQNNLTEFYWTRFMNSFNTQNDAAYVRDRFIVYYHKLFPTTPFYIEEFHSPDFAGNLLDDVMLLREISLRYSGDLFYGFNVFEFQKRSDKLKEQEERFGLFELGGHRITNVTLGRETYPVWCLRGVLNVNFKTRAPNGGTLPQAVAKALHGAGVNADIGCTTDPAVVPLDDAGYRAVCALGDVHKTKVFIERVILHMGGSVAAEELLLSKASRYCHDRPRFSGESSVLADLKWIRDHRWQPSQQWIRWEPVPVCTADKIGSDVNTVGRAVEALCKVVKMDCGNVPKRCLRSTWSLADYVFSFYYADRIAAGGPLSQEPMDVCYFGGASALKPNSYLNEEETGCVVTSDPATTAVTAEGWMIVKVVNDPQKTATFLKRVVELELHSEVMSQEELDKYSYWAWMAKDWEDLLLQLMWKPWVCGAGVNRDCSTSLELSPSLVPRGKYAWLLGPLLSVMGCALGAAVLAYMYIRLTPDPTQQWLQKQKIHLSGRSVEEGSSDSD